MLREPREIFVPNSLTHSRSEAACGTALRWIRRFGSLRFWLKLFFSRALEWFNWLLTQASAVVCLEFRRKGALEDTNSDSSLTNFTDSRADMSCWRFLLLLSSTASNYVVHRKKRWDWDSLFGSASALFSPGGSLEKSARNLSYDIFFLFLLFFGFVLRTYVDSLTFSE